MLCNRFGNCTKKPSPQWTTVALSDLFLSHCHQSKTLCLYCWAMRHLDHQARSPRMHRGVDISRRSSCGFQGTVHLPKKEKSTGRCGTEKLPAGQVAHFSAATGRRAPPTQTHTTTVCTDTHPFSKHRKCIRMTV